MKWSWKIGELAGIGVFVHATFFLIIGWVVLTHWNQTHSLEATVSGVIFILALFACVVLHELGHALTARRFGIKTRDITLLPIGGVARLERMPRDPRQELWVALAGPAVNVVIASLLFVWLLLTNSWQPLEHLGVAEGSFLERLMVVNVFLVCFNMLPAFPMDGGRVLRALLATRLDYVKATQLAATIGQGMALLFGFFGLFANPFLLFIALFVWIGAAQESNMVQTKDALGGITVDHAMITDFRNLHPGDTLSTAVDLILHGAQQDFPVVENGEVRGVLTRGDLIQALAHQGRDSPVAAAMQQTYPTTEPGEMLEAALTRIQGSDFRTIPVLQNGHLIGLLTIDNVGEFLMIQNALGSRRAS